MTTTTLHATTVAVQDRGLLIIGPSGVGKSSLALHLIALGALLVADDQTELTRTGTQVMARCPPALQGLIEARGLGILRAPFVALAPVCLVVDLSQNETERLPPHRSIDIVGARVDLVWATQSPHFPAAILRYVQSGRQA